LPARYTNRVACFSEVYIISNLSLNQLFLDEQKNAPEVYEAFRERIHEIIKFTAKYVWHYEKRQGDTAEQLQMTEIPPSELKKENLPW